MATESGPWLTCFVGGRVGQHRAHTPPDGRVEHGGQRLQIAGGTRSPGGQPVEHFEQRGPHLVVECDPVGRICTRGGRLDDVVGVHTFQAGSGGSDVVQTQPPGHHGQPRSDVLQAFDLDAGQPQESLLCGVLGSPMSPSI